MQSVPDHVHGLISFVVSLATVAVKVVIDAYFFAVDLERRQGKSAVGGQLRGINTMNNGLAQQPRLVEMRQRVHQQVDLLCKGKKKTVEAVHC
jgi:hypothetical protein